MHQPSDASGNALQSTTTYPTATPKIDSLGNTELILPKGNRLQRGAQGLANVANTLKSGLNTFVAQPLANAATYISQSSPRRQENPKRVDGWVNGVPVPQNVDGAGHVAQAMPSYTGCGVAYAGWSAGCWSGE
ncbi:uncharacterized protein DFL_005185 [Arthrobotrys flagrans]|uniref:Uncharacterized protein n=1 Tax=Arthrobotrys flagrans TaxID=97331 RepID=A0A437A6X8_ARTFL|nr:hypothetical protein DFL_005185 [Arthrobotrys flagrans]